MLEIEIYEQYCHIQLCCHVSIEITIVTFSPTLLLMNLETFITGYTRDVEFMTFHPLLITDGYRITMDMLSQYPLDVGIATFARTIIFQEFMDERWLNMKSWGSELIV
jgi:hypothetical protein